MDCGPSCLSSVLQGLGLSHCYEDLRRRCDTDVDGTSIDAIESLALDCGLEAEQVIIPGHHLNANTTLPAILVVALPNQLTHFVVLWRVVGNRAQIMDPARGRYWVSLEAL